MNASKFDAVVKNRAHEKVAARVKCFRERINAAFRELFSGVKADQVFDHYYEWLSSTDTVKKCLANCHRTRDAAFTNEWPKELWDHETEATTKQLLSIMDEMQRALVAPAPSEDWPQPCAINEKGKPCA